MTIRAAALWLAASAIAVPAAAQTPLSAEEFDAYTRGKTLYYGQGGVAYGIEEYNDARRVRWSFLDGECIEGHWYPQGDQICFAYEDQGVRQCWEFFLDTGGLSARVASDPEGSFLYETRQSTEPMLCLGPRIGV